jgi:hypothetical protein
MPAGLRAYPPLGPPPLRRRRAPTGDYTGKASEAAVAMLMDATRSLRVPVSR